MRAYRLLVAAVLVGGLVGCGAPDEKVMPDVVGKTLDVAESGIHADSSDEEIVAYTRVQDGSTRQRRRCIR